MENMILLKAAESNNYSIDILGECDDVLDTLAPGALKFVPIGTIRRDLNDDYWFWSININQWIPQGAKYLVWKE